MTWNIRKKVYNFSPKIRPFFQSKNYIYCSLLNSIFMVQKMDLFLVIFEIHKLKLFFWAKKNFFFWIFYSLWDAIMSGLVSKMSPWLAFLALASNIASNLRSSSWSSPVGLASGSKNFQLWAMCVVVVVSLLLFLLVCCCCSCSWPDSTSFLAFWKRSVK